MKLVCVQQQPQAAGPAQSHAKGWSPGPSAGFQLVTTLGDWGVGVGRLRLRTQPQQPTYAIFCPSFCPLPVSLRHQP